MADTGKINPNLPKLINDAHARFSLLLEDMDAIRDAGGEACIFTSRGHHDSLCFECSFSTRVEVPAREDG